MISNSGMNFYKSIIKAAGKETNFLGGGGSVPFKGAWHTPLKLGEQPVCDIVQLSKKTLNSTAKVLGNDLTKFVEKDLYDVTKWQDEFFENTYNKLNTPEERAVFISKLRKCFRKIKKQKSRNYDLDLETNQEKLNTLKENFPYLRKPAQENIIKQLKENKIPESIMDDFDNNKMFEMVLKDKKYNMDYVLDDISKNKDNIYDLVPEISKKMDENLLSIGFKPGRRDVKNPIQKMKQSEINPDLYHEQEYFHGIRGGNEQYKMDLFKTHGSSRFGPDNSTGVNTLFTTQIPSYAEWYGGNNVLKMYFRKEHPILRDVDVCTNLPSHFHDRLMDNLVTDLLYEKGVKYLENGRETMVLDPKAVTFVSDYKHVFNK